MKNLRHIAGLFVLCSLFGCGDPPAKNSNSQNGDPNNTNLTPNSRTNAQTNSNTAPTGPYAVAFDEFCYGTSLNGEAFAAALPAAELAVDLQWSDDSSVTEARFTVEFDRSADLTCVPGWEGPPNSGAASQPGELTIDDVTLWVSTDDGRLTEEEFSGRATMTDFGDGIVTIFADMPSESLNGTLAPLLNDEPVRTLYAEALFWGGNGSSGILGLSDDEQGTVNSWMNAASWPAR